MVTDTKFDSIALVWLPNMTIAWHGTTVTILPSPITDTDNNIVHDHICGTKCNNNDWCYPGNDAKWVSR